MVWREDKRPDLWFDVSLHSSCSCSLIWKYRQYSSQSPNGHNAQSPNFVITRLHWPLTRACTVVKLWSYRQNLYTHIHKHVREIWPKHPICLLDQNVRQQKASTAASSCAANMVLATWVLCETQTQISIGLKIKQRRRSKYTMQNYNVLTVRKSDWANSQISVSGFLFNHNCGFIKSLVLLMPIKRCENQMF